MALEGIGGGKPINDGKIFTMDSLGIKQGTNEASIFNKIDSSDGNVDGFLSETQYFEYMKEVSLTKTDRSDKAKLDEVEKKIEKQKEFLESCLDIKQKYKDAEFNSEKQTVTIKYLYIRDFDISSPEQFQKLKMVIAEMESAIETNRELIKKAQFPFNQD